MKCKGRCGPKVSELEHREICRLYEKGGSIPHIAKELGNPRNTDRIEAVLFRHGYHVGQFLNDDSGTRDALHSTRESTKFKTVLNQKEQGMVEDLCRNAHIGGLSKDQASLAHSLIDKCR